jgi:release factor glutamine methyltransferase
MTVQEATYYLLNKTRSINNEGEAASIADWVMEYLTGKSKLERFSGNQILLTTEQKEKLETIINRLLTHEPVQYVLNESWFGGLKFYVDKNVLIPRPETEELVEWIITNCKPCLPAGRFPVDELKILDIGTGSGCIPISLKRRLKKAEVWGCDVSAGALAVAKRNAATLGTDVNFIQLDFLKEEQRSHLPSFDIIVSNPPYVPEKDKGTMSPNVLQYEPTTALFVPDNNSLIFYKAIAEFGKKHFNKNGSIYCEIHESLGDAVVNLFNDSGYTTKLKKDMQQKDRMIKAIMSSDS